MSNNKDKIVEKQSGIGFTGLLTLIFITVDNIFLPCYSNK